MSFNSVQSTNNFTTTGTLIARSMSFGGNNDNSKSKSLQQSYFNVGSAYTQGNIIRSFYDMNSGPALVYTPTTDDALFVQRRYPLLFNRFPILQQYPWLYPFTETYPSVITGSKLQPLYRVSGKGFGVVEMYNVGSPLLGSYSDTLEEPMNQYYNFNIYGDIPTPQTPRNISNQGYPFSGLLYSGNIAQYTIDNGSIKIIPYQAGRGVPQWDISEDYYSGNPWGNPVLEDSLITLKPQLSWGVAPGNNDFCIGMVLDSKGDNKLFKYPEPTPPLEPENKKNVPYTDHPAPFSVGPTDVSFSTTPKIVSPGPNLSDTYWAPWPWYYGYSSGQQAPVMTKGKTSGKIGAAYNIGIQCYYEPEVAEGDDPRGNDDYLPVQIIPLFQGEKVTVGSEIYASAMGHVITWDARGANPYPVGSFVNASGQQLIQFSGSPDGSSTTFGCSRDAREENPWWDWYDPTFGAIGWTSTPGFSPTAIPDRGTALCQSKTQRLEYLAQSLQGSVIVRATTIANPLDEGGSGRMELIGPTEYNIQENKFNRITKVPGDGERTQTIGNSMQEITGTGRWTYDGSYDVDTTTLMDGVGYETGVLYDLVPLAVEGGVGGVIEVTGVDAEGQITSFNVVNLGSGYTTGEPVRATTGPNYYPATPLALGTTATLLYSGAPTLDPRGSGYVSGHKVMGYNISRHLGAIEMTVMFDSAGINQGISGIYGTPVSFQMTNIQDADLFTVGKVFWAINWDNCRKFTKDTSNIIFQVSANDGTTVEAVVYGSFAGEFFSYASGTYQYAVQMLDTNRPMELSIVTTGDYGQVDSIVVTDIGYGNWDGDNILVFQPGSDNNCIFKFQSTIDQTNCALPLVSGGAGYNMEQIVQLRWVNQNNYGNLYSTGGADSNLLARMISVSPWGSIYNLSWNITTGYKSLDLNLDFIASTATFGSKQIFQHIQNMDYIENAPVAQPVGGWESNITTNSATFLFESLPQVSNNGLGYTKGTTYATTGGTGTGMTILVGDTDEQGGLVAVEIADYGANYVANDLITLTGGDGNGTVILRVMPTDNVQPDYTPSGFTPFPTTTMIFNYQILDGGTGYTANPAVSLPTTTPNRITANLGAIVNDVDSNGSVKSITLTGSINDYNLGYIVTITGGNNDCYFKLVAPLSPQKTHWVSNGSGYTTAIGVPTLNVQQNNLVVMADVGAGTCLVYDWNVGAYDRPTTWDLNRYQVGDQLAVVQGGNQSAVYEIDTMDRAQGDITFTQISAGAGYTFNTTQYGWFSTVNTSITQTTVDITANGDGEITNVTINTLGNRYVPGDKLVIQQAGSNNNAVVSLQPIKNVTPWWEEKLNGRSPTAAQWNAYRSNLLESKNLFDDQVVFDMKMNHPNFMNNSYYNNGDGGRDFVNNNGGSISCSIQ